MARSQMLKLKEKPACKITELVELWGRENKLWTLQTGLNIRQVMHFDNIFY